MKMDWHIHSTFSDGKQSVDELIMNAEKIGLDSIAITDHFDTNDSSLYYMRNKKEEDVLRHFEHIRDAGSKSKIEVFVGIETGSDMDGRMYVSDRILNEADIVICSPHYVDLDKKGRSLMDEEYWEHYKMLLLSQADNQADIAGHPEGYLPAPGLEGTSFEERQRLRAMVAEKYLDEPFYREYASRLKKSGKAFEIHGASSTPRKWVLGLLRDEGVSFSVGSDAHDLPLLGRNERGLELVNELNLKIKRPIGKRRFI